MKLVTILKKHNSRFFCLLRLFLTSFHGFSFLNRLMVFASFTNFTCRWLLFTWTNLCFNLLLLLLVNIDHLLPSSSFTRSLCKVIATFICWNFLCLGLPAFLWLFTAIVFLFRFIVIVSSFFCRKLLKYNLLSSHSF